ncbi:MAG: hypothetical protein FJ303_16420 [Planctomycetes bacterium]|nr:hypothetical protein [Planctomycetota bacterium]
MDFNEFFKEHNSELMILALAVLILGTLTWVLPQLISMNIRKTELWHEERVRAIEKGLPLPMDDDRAALAARIALLVPMVVMISTATVTSFLVVYKSEHLFTVSLAIWVVGGTVSLAAITGGVALMGRLGRFETDELDEKEEEEEDNQHQRTSYMN